MIVEYIRYTVDEGRAQGFVDAYKASGDALLASPHCLRFELGRCEEEPTAFVVRIEWTSTRDHLEGFRGSDEFKAFFAHIKPFVGDIEEMRHYEVLEARERET